MVAAAVRMAPGERADGVAPPSPPAVGAAMALSRARAGSPAERARARATFAPPRLLAGTTPPPRARRRVTAGRRAKPSSRVQANLGCQLLRLGRARTAHGTRRAAPAPA